MSSSEFARQLTLRLERLPFLPPLATRQLMQLECYYELLRKWNRRINLTSLGLDAFLPETLDRLFIEPFVASSLLDDPLLCIDLGAGGGSPGIPLGISRPGMQLILVESKERKSAFLREVLRELPLVGDVVTSRADAIPAEYFGRADVVSARAVKMDETLAHLIRKLLTPNGSFLSFGSSANIRGFQVMAQRFLGDCCVRRLAAEP